MQVSVQKQLQCFSGIHTKRGCIYGIDTTDGLDTRPTCLPPKTGTYRHVAPAQPTNHTGHSIPPPFSFPRCGHPLPISVICLKCKVNNVPDWLRAKSQKKVANSRMRLIDFSMPKQNKTLQIGRKQSFHCNTEEALNKK